MKIFSKDIDSIHREIDSLKKGLLTCKSNDLIYYFYYLASEYQLIRDMGFKLDSNDIKILDDNVSYANIYETKVSKSKRKKIDNFIKNKALINDIANRMISIYDRNFNYRSIKPLYLEENQMAEIILDFLNDEFNQADKFKEMVNNNHIFNFGVGKEEEKMNTSAYTIHNFITGNSMMCLSNNNYIVDVNLMKNIVHEFGHVIDAEYFKSFSKKDSFSYLLSSDYSEVYSILYEKLFLEYLIKNRIFKSNAHTELVGLCIGIYNKFNSIGYLSTLDDNLLINLKYKKKIDEIKEKTNAEYEDEPFLDEMIETINDTITSDFEGINLYSYGGLIAYYFSYLKQNDPSMYNEMIKKFDERKSRIFDSSIFETIGTTEDEIIEIYSKCLDRITGKKLILE